MGHKVNPTSFRLAVNKPWQSRWFSSTKYTAFLREDVQIREFLEKQFRKAGVVSVEISRGVEGVPVVTVYTTKPGMLIGKGGAGIDLLAKRLQRELGLSHAVRLNIEEVRQPNLSAQAVANHIAEQIERRVAFRRLLKQAVEQVMLSGAKGVKVMVGGRLNGAEIARTEHLSNGTMPLHTLRAHIDFARSTAFTTYGTVGIKVWISMNADQVLGSPTAPAKESATAPRRPWRGNNNTSNRGDRR